MNSTRGTKLEDGHFTGVRNAAGKNNEYEIKDDLPILKFYDAHKNDSAEVLAKEVLSNTDFWGEDLTKIPGLLDAVTEAMKMSETEGTYAVMQKPESSRISSKRNKTACVKIL